MAECCKWSCKLSVIVDDFLISLCFFHRNFCVKRDFISNPATLKKRLMVVGLAMLLLSPFLVIFMLVYLFLRHAEQFYNHPSTASSQRWSTLAKWIFREYNEVIVSIAILSRSTKNTACCITYASFVCWKSVYYFFLVLDPFHVFMRVAYQFVTSIFMVDVHYGCFFFFLSLPFFI